MIQHIKHLLENHQLKQQVKESTNLVESIKMITNASVQEGYFVTHDSVAEIVTGLMLTEQELTEEELLAVSGGLRNSCTVFTSWDSIFSVLC
jgi:hypothetical protein